MDSTATAEVLWIGDAGREEFAPAAAWLAARCRLARRTGSEAIDPGAFLAADPELVVIAQAWQGQFSVAFVAGLRRRFPLSRLVALLGPLCDGAERSGPPWPGVWRWPWHQGPRRLDLWFRCRERGDLPGWGHPLTDPDWPALAVPPPAQSGLGTVELRGGPAEQAQWLADACRALGYLVAGGTLAGGSVTGGASDPETSARLWTGSLHDPRQRQELRKWAQSVAPAAVLAAVAFPRPADLHLAENVRLLGLPVTLAELAAAIGGP